MGKYLDLAKQVEARLKGQPTPLTTDLQSVQDGDPWSCPHCGQPAVIEEVCPSLDGLRTLTLWHCDPCQTWGVTPNTVREPPVWVPKTEQ
jgi:hypothetical protein